MSRRRESASGSPRAPDLGLGPGVGGHTEATVDQMQLAGLKPFGVLCELTRQDGSMARLPDLVGFGRLHRMPMLTI